ncbi:alpha/beta hydrolase [Pseudoduganella eburnea]|uniref:Alpha/beta hydrolase n=1 Tax=Massilia eburnea TaxID=1776165 RepID=A0A6L6QHK8_9BURK|nr:alpha/beta fold hydrolase [Massilia eburnea]MTW11641.1 alpha/beta hydrolase [Massilia eburnea]
MKPVLVLLPGMDGTGELFTPFIQALGGQFDVRVVKYPGDHGGGYDELEALARAALPQDRPYFLLGESFSGPIAVSIAASAPQHLSGLVLCCTFAHNPRPRLAALKALIGVMPVKALPAAWLVSEQLRAPFNAALSKVTSNALRARMRAVLAVDVRSRLAACNVPILYLQAKRDLLVPPGAANAITSIKPAVKLAAFDAPHFLLQTVPREAAREVGDFVRLNARR